LKADLFQAVGTLWVVPKSSSLHQNLFVKKNNSKIPCVALSFPQVLFTICSSFLKLFQEVVPAQVAFRVWSVSGVRDDATR
jgi:hypothetical protein